MNNIKFFAPNECWEWIGYKNKRGYGVVKRKIGNIEYGLAHRYSYALAYGDPDKNLFVCHHCDNPSCINPDHLFLGTHLDNMRDMGKKGRHWFANKTHCPKGHEYTFQNTRIYNYKNVRARVCKACDYMRPCRKKQKSQLIPINNNYYYSPSPVHIRATFMVG